LRDKKFREEMLLRHAAASAKIEGVKNAYRRILKLAKENNLFDDRQTARKSTPARKPRKRKK
jgi:hypothetical protein